MEDLGKTIWLNMSRYFVDHVPKFMFTIQNDSTKELTHYEINENIDKNHVNFKLKRIDLNNDEKVKIFKYNLTNYLNNFQTGGDADKTKEGSKDNTTDKTISKKNSNTIDILNELGDNDSSSSSSASSEFTDKKMLKKIKYKNYYGQDNDLITHFWYYPLLYETNFVYFPTFMPPLVPQILVNVSTDLIYWGPNYVSII